MGWKTVAARAAQAGRGLLGAPQRRGGGGGGAAAASAAASAAPGQAPEAPAVASPAIHGGKLSFPAPFFFGAATAAYQIEGAAAEGGRKPSTWDDFSHRPGKTSHGATGDVACDHYHRFRRDVAILSRIGFQAYRFSISWSRLIPDGEGEVNEEGARFYSELVDALLERGIVPWVTLYHWDMPSALESKFGGWLGPKERVAAAFGAYARACFSLLGDRVKHWITLNEPWCNAVLGYHSGQHAPGRREAVDTDPYTAGHNMLLAHAEAVRVYRSEFAAEQQGRIGITLNADWRQPGNPDSWEDKQAASRAMDFSLGWFAEPVFFGHYPRHMVNACGERLPRFSEEESELLRGSADFFGINSYSSNFARQATKPLKGGGYWEDIGVEWWHTDRDWERTDMGWPIVPWGFRELLLHIQRRYAPPGGIVVTENGCAYEPESSREADSRPEALIPRELAEAEKEPRPYPRPPAEAFADAQRVRFFRAHLSAVHAARALGADVRGYFAWSFLDNFEWGEGYTKRFGVVHVDYPTQTRTVKASGHFFAQTIRKRGFEAPPLEEQYGGQPF